MRRSVALVALVAVAVTGCSRGPEEAVARRGAESPVAAVEELIAAVSEPDFDEAASLAMPGQAALASLAEGASFGDVAGALRDGGSQVTANFWAGFAQGAGDYLTGDLELSANGTQTVDDVVFHRVDVLLPDGSTRRIYTRDEDGHRIDLFASFGGAIAGRMVQPTERLLTTHTEDTRLILRELQGIVPSLLVAASNTELQPTFINDVNRLIEVITRYGVTGS